MRIGKPFSSTMHALGLLSESLEYSLFTQKCVAKYDNNRIIKFADDATEMRLISNSGERHYREQVEDLTI